MTVWTVKDEEPLFSQKLRLIGHELTKFIKRTDNQSMSLPKAYVERHLHKHDHFWEQQSAPFWEQRSAPDSNEETQSLKNFDKPNSTYGNNDQAQNPWLMLEKALAATFIQ